MVSRNAFTLIELLVVITIIALLSGMLIASANLLGFGSKREQTRLGLSAVQQALELTLAERGSLPAPVEHPLAGSAPPRATWQRSGDPGATIASAGEALRGVRIDQVIDAARNRLLLDDDRYADDSLPLLYGLRRDQIGILGSPQAGVTAYRQLLPPEDDGVVPDLDGDRDYTAADYPDRLHLVVGQGGPGDTARVLEYVLGSTNAASELRRSGMLSAPDPGSGTTIRSGRVFTRVPDGGGEADWSPGSVRAGTLDDGPEAGRPAWRPYRLLGPAITDAWGVEVLYRSDRGRIQLRSAGPDGVFRWHPGPDGVLSTAPEAEFPAGDDLDGSEDDVTLGILE